MGHCTSRTIAHCWANSGSRRSRTICRDYHRAVTVFTAALYSRCAPAPHTAHLIFFGFVAAVLAFWDKTCRFRTCSLLLRSPSFSRLRYPFLVTFHYDWRVLTRLCAGSCPAYKQRYACSCGSALYLHRCGALISTLVWKEKGDPFVSAVHCGAAHLVTALIAVPLLPRASPQFLLDETRSCQLLWFITPRARCAAVLRFALLKTKTQQKLTADRLIHQCFIIYYGSSSDVYLQHGWLFMYIAHAPVCHYYCLRIQPSCIFQFCIHRARSSLQRHAWRFACNHKRGSSVGVHARVLTGLVTRSWLPFSFVAHLVTLPPLPAIPRQRSARACSLCLWTGDPWFG